MSGLCNRVYASLNRAFVAALLCIGLVLPAAAHASVTVLVGEPFGKFGTMVPNGHTSIYLDRVCANGPVQLRMCQPGEAPGVVIARYAIIGNHDWLAIPVLQYLYASDDPDNLLAYGTPQALTELRQSYRRRFLSTLFPDGTEHAGKTSEWWETIGMAYYRRLWGYQLASTREQDELLVARLNARRNRKVYRVAGANCANFAADVVNFYYPGTVRHDKVADFGLMTPKQVARSVYSYGMAHPETQLRVLEIPQMPGSLRRSRPVRGAAESLIKIKRYLATLLVIQPELPAISLALYLRHGRWSVARSAERMTPDDFARAPDRLVASN